MVLSFWEGTLLRGFFSGEGSFVGPWRCLLARYYGLNRVHLLYASGRSVVVGIVGFTRAGSILGRCITRVHSMTIRNSHVHFHHGVRHVKRVVTCRVDGRLACSIGRMRAPLKITSIDAPSSRIIVTAIFHTKLPLRAKFLGVFSRTKGTFISTCHCCGSGRYHAISMRVRCVTAPSLSGGALLVMSPVLTAKRDVRLT